MTLASILTKTSVGGLLLSALAPALASGDKPRVPATPRIPATERVTAAGQETVLDELNPDGAFPRPRPEYIRGDADERYGLVPHGNSPCLGPR